MTEVTARMDGEVCALEVISDCEPIQMMAEELQQVDPMAEIGYHGDGPATLRVAARHCPHPACPIPAGILKAVEVAAGLALPKDASITLVRSEE